MRGKKKKKVGGSGRYFCDWVRRYPECGVSFSGLNDDPPAAPADGIDCSQDAPAQNRWEGTRSSFGYPGRATVSRAWNHRPVQRERKRAGRKETLVVV